MVVKTQTASPISRDPGVKVRTLVPTTPPAAVSQPGTTDPADSLDSPPAPGCLLGAIPLYSQMKNQGRFPRFFHLCLISLFRVQAPFFKFATVG
jgi:hypothetical protein